MRRPLAVPGLGAAGAYLRPCYFRMWKPTPRASPVGPTSQQTFFAPHEQLQSLPEAGEGLLAALQATGVQDCPIRWMGFTMIVELVLPAKGLGWQWSVHGDDPKTGTNSPRA